MPESTPGQRARYRRWYARNREKKIAAKREYYLKNRSYLIQKARERYLKNRDQIREAARARHKELYAFPAYRETVLARQRARFARPEVKAAERAKMIELKKDPNWLLKRKLNSANYRDRMPIEKRRRIDREKSRLYRARHPERSKEIAAKSRMRTRPCLLCALRPAFGGNLLCRNCLKVKCRVCKKPYQRRELFLFAHSNCSKKLHRRVAGLDQI